MNVYRTDQNPNFTPIKSLLTIQLRRQKRCCPICGECLFDRIHQTSFIFKDGDRRNHKENNVILVHDDCIDKVEYHNGQMVETVGVKEETSKTDGMPLNFGMVNQG